MIMKMKQCRLSLGTAEQVAWIEERGAHVGARVEIKEDGQRWVVTEVYPYAMDADKLREKQASDRNALPSIKGQ